MAAHQIISHTPEDYEACILLMWREGKLLERMRGVIDRLDDDDSDDFDRHLAGDQLVGLATVLRDLLKQHPRFEA